LSGVYCRRCRDLARGRGWRLRIAARFAVPGGGTDFDCPHGKPWGYMPEGKAVVKAVVKAKPVPAYVAERRKICDACAVDGLDCQVKYHRKLQEARGVNCWFTRYVAAVESTCPMGYWPVLVEQVSEGGLTWRE